MRVQLSTRGRPTQTGQLLGMVVAIIPLVAAWNPIERPNRAVTDGNASLQKGKAEDALARYDQAAAALPADPAVHFDRGSALFALSRFDEAIVELMRATETKSSVVEGRQPSTTWATATSRPSATRTPLRPTSARLGLAPGDMRAKWNLELALQKKQEEDKKKQEQQDQDKDKKKQDDQKNQDDQKKQDKKQDEKKQEPDAGAPKQEPPKPPQGQDAGTQPPPQEEPAAQPKDDKAPEMSEIDAVLDSLEQSPKDLEKMRARLRAVRRAPPAKDW